jgi:hypothetical protein
MIRLSALRLIQMLFVLKILNLRTGDRGVNGQVRCIIGNCQLTRLELLEVLRRDLGDLEQTDGALVVDEGTTLDVSLGLVRDLHKELGLGLDHVLENLVVDDGAEVVRVRYKQVLLALGDKLVEDARVEECVEQVTVTGRVPVLLVVIRGTRARQERLLEDTRVPALVERGDAQLLVRVLLDDPERVVVGVERGHEHERDVDLARGVQVLNLAHGQVEEGHVVLDLKGRLCAGHA